MAVAKAMAVPAVERDVEPVTAAIATTAAAEAVEGAASQRLTGVVTPTKLNGIQIDAELASALRRYAADSAREWANSAGKK